MQIYIDVAFKMQYNKIVAGQRQTKTHQLQNGWRKCKSQLYYNTIRQIMQLKFIERRNFFGTRREQKSAHEDIGGKGYS